MQPRKYLVLGALGLVFGYGGPGGTTLVSTIRIRQLGFSACVDTECMFRHQLRRLQAERVLPR